MITNNDVYRCYSVSLMQFLSSHNIRYFLIAKDIKSSRTFWAYEKTEEFNNFLQEWVNNNPNKKN